MAYLLDHLLSESAARRPDGIAVIHEQNSLTYGELEASSNRLAHALLASGVKPGDRVGIYLPKSIDRVDYQCFWHHESGGVLCPFAHGLAGAKAR